MVTQSTRSTPHSRRYWRLMDISMQLKRLELLTLRRRYPKLVRSTDSIGSGSNVRGGKVKRGLRSLKTLADIARIWYDEHREEVTHEAYISLVSSLSDFAEVNGGKREEFVKAATR